MAQNGSEQFCEDYGVKQPYIAGSMFKGISSPELVVRMGRAGLMGFLGTGGLSLEQIENSIKTIQRDVPVSAAYGMNLLYALDDTEHERATVELFLRYGVNNIEAAGYLQITEPLVRYRFAGAHRDARGRPVAVNRVVAKVSRPEVAAAFMAPPPVKLRGVLTPEEADAAAELPMSEDICVEADSAGHTDGGVALTLLPAMVRMRDRLGDRYPKRIRVGAAGGLGAPEAVAAAFTLGAQFVVTGSVNQCTPEAGTSDLVKQMLAELDVQDTTYAPAGDMFELGARVQVVRRGTLFAARANKLHQLYRQHGSLDELGPATLEAIETGYFGRSCGEVWRETAEYLARERPRHLDRATRDPKQRMASVFRWYFVHSARMAQRGIAEQQVNFQIHCGPAMGAFNHVVRGTALEHWRHRHVDKVAELLMEGAAEILSHRTVL